MNSQADKKKPSSRRGIKSTAKNLFLNLSIILLSAVVIYMGYSIYIKLHDGRKGKELIVNEKEANEIIQVEVLNGCGAGGAAEKFTDYLRSKNLDVVKSGNYISDDVGESLVIDRTGNSANAQKAAKLLGIKSENVIQQLNKDYLLDITVVIGRDYFNLAPYK